MPFAARISDPTAHGGIVTIGFPTVIIGGMPASRIGDMHTCPMFTGLVPHVGGPFILGSFTVIVGSMPQSKVGDMLICVGPPDTLIMGCPTVQVGMAGGGGGAGAVMAGLAALVGQLLSGGYPRAVLQPDGTYATEYNSQITVKGSPEYQAAVISDLNAFLGTPTGKAWQADYAATGKHITIRPSPPTWTRVTASPGREESRPTATMRTAASRIRTDLREPIAATVPAAIPSSCTILRTRKLITRRAGERRQILPGACWGMK